MKTAGSRSLTRKAIGSTSKSYSAPINRILGDKFMKDKQFIVADAAQMRALTPSKQTAPFWYSPLLAGLLACVVIAVVAFCHRLDQARARAANQRGADDGGSAKGATHHAARVH